MTVGSGLAFDKVRTLGAMGRTTRYDHDKLDRLVRTVRPVVDVYSVARTLGNFIDGQVRDQLRFLAKIEGINDSMTYNIWAVNRGIRSDLVEGRGIPDNRLGYNLFADTTLALKSGGTEQIMKWNAIRPDANYVMIRPAQIGGSYVIPRMAIQQPYLPSRPMGRGL